MSPSAVADGTLVMARTREDIIEALQEYARKYGQPSTASFNPSLARWRSRPELAERYKTPRDNGMGWPSTNSIKRAFGGSFNDALIAAGLPVNKPGPDRRRALEHAPIRDVRVERVEVRSDQADRQIVALRAQLAAARERADLAEREVRKAVVVKRPPKVIVKTKTRTVRDERALERARSKLADEQAARRAVQDQLASALADAARLEAELVSVHAEAAESRAQAQETQTLYEQVSDRALAAESRVERLSAELAEAQHAAGESVERALAADYVQAAERQVRAAELRVAQVEREMAEQASAITGSLRRLTAAELAELKTSGPAGPKVFGEALNRFARARARGSNAELSAALGEVKRAAHTWQARIR